MNCIRKIHIQGLDSWSWEQLAEQQCAPNDTKKLFAKPNNIFFFLIFRTEYEISTQKMMGKS